MVRVRPFAILAVVAAMMVVLAAPQGAMRASASSGSLRVDPPTQSVPPGSSFTVDLIQSAEIATIGAEATLTFDRSLLQILDLQPGPDYAAATFIVGETGGGAAGGTQTSIADAIADANETGALRNVTVFLTPGSGTVPPGETVFATVTFQAVAPGSSPLKLTHSAQDPIEHAWLLPIFGPVPEGADPGWTEEQQLDVVITRWINATSLIDELGELVPVTTTDGAVTIDDSAPPPPPPNAGAPTPGGSAVPGAQATAGAAPARTAGASNVLGTTNAPSLKTATFSIAPATQKVAKEDTFTFEIKQQVDGSASAAQAKVTFRRDLLEVVKLEPDSGWSASASALDASVKDANNSGEINVTLSADKTNPPSASGESTILTVTMRGQPGKQGKSDLKLATADIVGTDGSSVPVTMNGGAVVVGSASGGGLNATWIIAGAVVVLAVGGAGAFVVRRRMGAA